MQTPQYIYSIFLQKYDKENYEKTGNLDDRSQDCSQKKITLYLPELTKKMGKTDQKGVVKLIEGYKQNLVGILCGDASCGTEDQELAVIDYCEYDKKKKTITLTSPYIMAIMKKVAQARLEKKKKYPKKYKGDDLPPGYSYRVDPKLLGARCKKVMGMVIYVATLIDMAGSPKCKRDENKKVLKDENGNPIIDEKKVAHSTFQGIMDRSDSFAGEYEAKKKEVYSNPNLTSQERCNILNLMLERAFKPTWKYVLRFTNIEECYREIQLPDPHDRKYIPTSRRLKEVLKFRHKGKK